MGFFDDYDILGGLSDLACAPFKAADKVLFGGPGEVGGIIGTPIKAALDNPAEAAKVVGATVVAGAAVAVAGPAIGAAAGALSAATGTLSGATAGATGLATGLAANSLLRTAGSKGLAAVASTSTKLTAKEIALYQCAGFLAREVASHIVDNYVRENVCPVEGSIIYCDLGLVAEHSGVYVGADKIVHLNGDGNIEVVTRDEFLRRLGGLNLALSIYVSCLDCHAIGNSLTAERALAMVGRKREYNLVLDNCHQFTSGCITGDFENSDNFWCALKNTVENHYASNCWRIWRGSA